MYSTGNKIVDEVGMINIDGNVIPHAWYSHFKLPSGKPDLNAMIILSEIVYWYRPTTVRDEATGSVTGVKKKFKADLLQRSYDSFANQFGLTKRQVKEAMDRLCDSRVIWREFRTINTNIKITNVLFIGINTDLLSHVSALHGGTLKSNTLLRSNVPPSHDKTSHPPTLECKTNTEITTEITTESSARAENQNQKSGEPLELNLDEIKTRFAMAGIIPSTGNVLANSETIGQELYQFNQYYSHLYMTESQAYAKLIAWFKRIKDRGNLGQFFKTQESVPAGAVNSFVAPLPIRGVAK